MKNQLRTPAFLIAALIGLLLVILAYKDHFNNPFHFDDSHTIENNVYIRDIKNIPEFFVNAETTSSLPTNQAYRPGLTTLNTIDTWIGGKGEPVAKYFHAHIFLAFLVLGVLLFFFYRHIFERALPENNLNHWLALFGAVWFWVHAANAETVNYIIARSDTQSTLWILIAFSVYLFSAKGREYFLFLIPMAIGFTIKEPALMLAPLVVVFEWLFGKMRERKTILRIVALFVTGMVLYLISREFTPKEWTSGQNDHLAYLITQPWVMVHYFANFVLPVDLSVDTDWQLLNGFGDYRLYLGVLFVMAMLAIAYLCSKKQEHKPITFGILWFFIALAPTSSVFPFAEVLNDHRVFFPYIGLIMAFTWGIGLLLVRLQKRITQGRSPIQLPTLPLGILALAFLSAHAYGAHTRCAVWSSGYTLWGDCAVKSPENPRALMNYGLTLVDMGSDTINKNKAVGDSLFNVADSIYKRAEKMWDSYVYLAINIGVLREWQGRYDEAETYFKKAISFQPDHPEGQYYLADFYVRRGRGWMAVPYVKHGLKLSPAHIGMNRLREMFETTDVDEQPLDAAIKKAGAEPTAENYLNLSLEFYNAKDYAGCVRAGEEALKINPGYADAYNNICSAWIKLGDWDKAIDAGGKAIQIKPDYQLATNNLKVALQNKNYFETNEKLLRAKPDAAGWINISLQYYKIELYAKSAWAAEQAVAIAPNNADAWNNICAAWNAAGDWKKAMPACEKAVSLNPTFELAKNNLAEAQRLKGVAGGK